MSGIFLSFAASTPSSTPITGTQVTVSTTYTTSSTYPIRGYLYYPTSENVGSSLDVVALYHGTITGATTTPVGAAQVFMDIAKNPTGLNLTDKIIFSVAYPQDAIPAWNTNPSLATNLFPGLNYSTLLFGDNIVYAEAALLWVKNNLNAYLATLGAGKTINKVFTFGHSQGGYLVNQLNTLHQVDGVISNAPGPIDLLDRCSLPGEQTANLTCNKINNSLGSTTTNPTAYNTRSVKNYVTGTLSPILYTQALDDESYQVSKMQNILQPLMNACANCSGIEFKYYATGGHDSFVTNTTQQQDIRNFLV